MTDQLNHVLMIRVEHWAAENSLSLEFNEQLCDVGKARPSVPLECIKHCLHAGSMGFSRASEGYMSAGRGGR